MTVKLQGREACPVARPDFKSGEGSISIPRGFDSHSFPPYNVHALTPKGWNK
jgi:hypothetical protein